MGRRFTLVELMIVVAIIGILAAIAVPNFVEMQYKTKRSELWPNTDGICTAQFAYLASHDTFITCTLVPATLTLVPDNNPGKQKRAWITGTNFDTIGWAPDGDVYGSYWATLPDPDGNRVNCEGMTNVDGDTNPAWRGVYAYNSGAPMEIADPLSDRY